LRSKHGRGFPPHPRKYNWAAGRRPNAELEREREKGEDKEENEGERERIHARGRQAQHLQQRPCRDPLAGLPPGSSLTETCKLGR